MSRVFVFLVVATNVIGSLLMIYSFFTNTALNYSYGVLAILNGVAFLITIIVVARSNLTERQKNFWIIISFVGVGVGQLLFLLRNPNVFQRLSR